MKGAAGIVNPVSGPNVSDIIRLGEKRVPLFFPIFNGMERII